MGTMQAHGISCTLGTGWSGCIIKHDDGSEDIYAPCLYATTCSMTNPPAGTFAPDVADHLSSNQVLVVMSESYSDHIVQPGTGIFAANGVPCSLTLADFSASRVAPSDGGIGTLAAAQKFCTVNGRPYTVYVVLGSATQSLVDSVNSFLSTVTVEPLADAYREYTLETPGLLAYWRLGELSGSTARDERNTYPATYYNGRVHGRTGLIVRSGNTATEFQWSGSEGTGGHAKVETFPALTSAFTVEAWCKIPNLSNPSERHILLSKLNSYALAVTDAGEVELALYAPNSESPKYVRSPRFRVVADQAHHVAATLGGASPMGVAAASEGRHGPTSRAVP